MADFLLLGQVPGTNIIITFSMWLTACMAVLCLVACWILITRRKQIEAIIKKIEAAARKRYQLWQTEQASL